MDQVILENIVDLSLVTLFQSASCKQWPEPKSPILKGTTLGEG